MSVTQNEPPGLGPFYVSCFGPHKVWCVLGLCKVAISREDGDMQGKLKMEDSFFLSTQLIFIYLFFNYCCIGGPLWHLQKFLPYVIVEFTPFCHLVLVSYHPPEAGHGFAYYF
jgi:hypothetical protein